MALDDHGRPDFHALQHFQASASRIHYFVFDLLIWKGRDLTKLPLIERRERLASLKLCSPIRISEQFDISPDDMIAAVREQGLSFVRDWVEKKIRGHLMRAGKRSGFGWKRWSRKWLYEELGLYDDYRLRRSWSLPKVRPTESVS